MFISVLIFSGGDAGYLKRIVRPEMATSVTGPLPASLAFALGASLSFGASIQLPRRAGRVPPPLPGAHNINRGLAGFVKFLSGLWHQVKVKPNFSLFERHPGGVCM